MLSPALAALEEYRQFITYKLIPLENGKFDKIPCDWRTGQVGVNPHDSQYHTEYATAAATGNPVAFVLTDRDPFFCLDIDGCLQPDGAWSPFALSLLAALPGTACEVSQSGTGLHVWGRYTSIPPHCVKPRGLGLELYHELRFIALGHPGATGSIGADCTEPLSNLVAAYFPPSAASQVSTLELTSGPVAEWRGPTEDGDLIRRACLSGGLSSAFGGKARFIDLWEGDIDVLAASYPTPDRRDGLPYDASSADAALAAHLRFWTGADEERMAALMLQSGLRRDKYDREDYLHRTIKLVTQAGGQVCQDTPSAAATEAALAETVSLTPRAVEGSPFAGSQDQLALFDGCVYITDVNRILTKNGQLLDHERFKSRYGGLVFTMDEENRKTTEDPWACFMLSRAIRFPKVDESYFRPDLPPRHVGVNGLGRSVVNIYRPFSSPRVKGDPGPFLDLVRKLLPIPRDRGIILAYMAAVVQHLGCKFKWAPLIQGVEGNGKSTLNECVAEAVGRMYCHSPRASQIASPFNGWMYGKVFVGVDDIYLNPKQDVVEELKPMITSATQDIQFKGVDQVTREVCFNMMLNCNSKDGIRKTRNDRRFAPFYTAQQEASDLKRDGMDGDYFRNLYSWLKKDGFAIVSEFLHTYEIPDELNPALGWRAPITSSTEEAISHGMGTVEQEIMERVERGEAGFAGGWISSFAFDRLLDDLRKNVPRNHRKEILNSLGYVWHPNLPDGRLNNPINDAGSTGRPRLFLKNGHLAMNLRNGGDILRAYLEAQSSAAKPVAEAGFGR